MSLAKRTTTGIFWNFFEQLSKRGVNIVVTLLLARFLIPEDYGLVAMMSVFLAIANSLMDMGFNQALIQKKDATNVDFCTAFYANLFLGFFSYLLLFFLAPLIASFYEQPILTSLIRVAGIAIVINSFQIVQNATLSRSLNFKAQLKASVPATIISGLLAVMLAYMGFGVWALIAQTIISSLIITSFLWSMDLWRPALSFSKISLTEMLRFGSNLFFSGLLDTIFRNLYVVVIAKFFAVSIAGHYFFATKIKELILNQLVKSIQTVTYPALVTLQENDIRLKAGYRKVIQVTTFGLFPTMAFVAALADPLFRVFLTEKWMPAVPYLKIICMAGLMHPLNLINLNILKVKGRSDLFLRVDIINNAFTLLILLISIQFGIMGVLIGQLISSILSYLPNSYYSGKLINYSAFEQIKDFFPGLFLSGIVALFIYFAVELSHQTALIELIFFGSLAGFMYITVCYIFKLEGLKLTEQLLKEKVNERGFLLSRKRRAN